MQAAMSDVALDAADIWQTIADLRQQGAEQHAAVRFHYLVALAQRAATQEGRARQLLERKLTDAAAACAARLAPAPQSVCAAPPHHALVKAAETLGGLARACGQHSLTGSNTDAAIPGAAPVRVELKTAQQHRATWSRLSAEKQLSQALEQPPTNPGPINSHMLVLRSVALMRDTSPDYLRRFISYVDTLLLLEQSDSARPAPVATAAGARAKPKPLRAVPAKQARAKK